jgi:hypothetical protein
VTDKTAEKSESTGWLVLIYRVPPEPTRLRSTVWRRIKSLGAIYLQNSAAARPASAATERALRKLRREILDMSGTAILLSCDVLVDLVKLRNWFAKVRDRDAFDADGRQAAEKSLDECEQSLEAYATRVYAEEAEGRTTTQPARC